MQDNSPYLCSSCLFPKKNVKQGTKEAEHAIGFSQRAEEVALLHLFPLLSFAEPPEGSAWGGVKQQWGEAGQGKRLPGTPDLKRETALSESEVSPSEMPQTVCV